MYCECGCGQVTRISSKTRAADGHIKGQHMRFIKGHNPRGKSKPRVSVEGYVNIRRIGYNPTNPYIGEHILIAEKAIGHKLPLGSIVHHVDENRMNNNNSNLVICQDIAYHKLLHRRMKALSETGNSHSEKCVHCKKWSIPELDPNLRISGRSVRHLLCQREYDKKRYMEKKICR